MKKTFKLNKWVAMAGLAFIALGMTAVNHEARASEVTWKMATPWGGGPWLERDAKGFAKNVAQLTDGRIKIDVYPGGTLSNPLKVTDAVRHGVVEIGHNWMAYDWGRDRTTALFSGYAGSPTPEGYLMWIYDRDGLELWQKFRDEKFGVVSFPCAIIGTEIFLHSNKKVENIEDFKGLKLRTSGAWAEIAEELGASTIVVPGAEVYTALDRGVIDATEWGSPEINEPTGFIDIAKYIVVPGMHQPGGVLECEINKKVWEGLSQQDKDAIATAAKLSMYESWSASANADLRVFKEMSESGKNEVVHLSPEFMSAVAAATRSWEDKQAEKDDGWFKRVLESLRSFENELVVWPEYRFPIGKKY